MTLPYPGAGMTQPSPLSIGLTLCIRQLWPLCVRQLWKRCSPVIHGAHSNTNRHWKGMTLPYPGTWMTHPSPVSIGLTVCVRQLWKGVLLLCRSDMPSHDLVEPCLPMLEFSNGVGPCMMGCGSSKITCNGVIQSSHGFLSLCMVTCIKVMRDDCEAYQGMQVCAFVDAVICALQTPIISAAKGVQWNRCLGCLFKT